MRDSEVLDLAFLMIADPARPDRILQLQSLSPCQRGGSPLPQRRPRLIRPDARRP